MLRFLLCLMVGALLVSAETNELIVLLPRSPAPVPVAAAPATPAEPQTIEEAYARWYKLASIVMLDSPSGPVPGFGMDTTYDARGFPVPRLPDPFSLAVYAEPTNIAAMDRLLDWRRAVIRRMTAVTNAAPDRAFERGIVTPEVLALGANRPTDQKAIGNYTVLDKKALGTPMLSPADAREAGITKPEDIPVLPGKPSSTGIEVYWYWHHRCPYCVSMARDWFAFQRAVNAYNTAENTVYKAVSINLSSTATSAEMTNSSYDLNGVLEMWGVTWGEDVQYSRNFLDFTDSAKAFKIDATPVTIFINRTTKPVTVLRLSGSQSTDELRAALAEVAHWSPDVWPPPKPTPSAITSTKQEPPLETHPQGTSSLQDLLQRTSPAFTDEKP